MVNASKGLRALEKATRHLSRAAQAAGHAVFAILQPSLHWATERGVCAKASRLTLLDTDHPWCAEGESAILPLRDLDAVVMRKDPPFDME